MINKIYILIFISIFISITIIFWGDNYYSYHFILLIFLTFIIINYFLPKKLQIILFNTFICFIIFSYFFELYLIKQKQDKFNHYTSLMRNGDIIKLVLPIENFYSDVKNKILPLSGISYSRTLHCNENGYYSIYNSDRFGFNNLDKNYDENIIDYIFLGDSFVHGACVNYENTLSSLIQEKLNKIVINFGFDGNGTLTSYAALKEFYPKKTSVKNVIYFLSESNDIKDIVKENRDQTLNEYYKNDKFTNNLVNNKEKYNLIIDDLMKNKINKFSKNINIYYNFFTLKNLREIIMPYFYIQNILSTKDSLDKNNQIQNFNKVVSIILKMRDYSEIRNSNFIIVYLPSWETYKLKNNKEIEKNYDLFIDFFNKNKINYIDLRVLFDNLEKPLDFFSSKNKNSHYNENGYKLISNYIHKELLLMN